MTLDDDCNIIAKHDLVYKGRKSFIIGHGTKSCTEIPEFYFKPEIYFVDCPGVPDSDP